MGGIQCQEKNSCIDTAVKLSSIDIDGNRMLSFMLSSVYNDHTYGRLLDICDDGIRQPDVTKIPCPTPLVHITPRQARFQQELPYTREDLSAQLDEDRFDEQQQLGTGRFNTASQAVDSCNGGIVVVKEGHKSSIRGKFVDTVEGDSDASGGSSCLLCTPSNMLGLLPRNIAMALYAPQKPAPSAFTRSAGDNNEHQFQDQVATQRLHDVDTLQYHWYTNVCAGRGLTHCAQGCDLVDCPLALQGLICLYLRVCIARVSSCSEVLETDECLRTVSTFRGNASAQWDGNKWKQPLQLLALHALRPSPTNMVSIQFELPTNPSIVSEKRVLREYVARLVGNKQDTVKTVHDDNNNNELQYISSQVSDSVLFVLACNVLQCQSALSVAGVAHRDVKPQNMVVAVDTGLTLIDYSEARVSTKETNDVKKLHNSLFSLQMMADDSAGTSSFLAPELCDEQQFNADRSSFDLCAQDVYAFGVLLYIFGTGYQPFHAYNENFPQPQWISQQFFQDNNNYVTKNKLSFVEDTSTVDAMYLVQKPIFPTNASPLAYDNLVFEDIAASPLAWPQDCTLSLEARDFVARMMEKRVDHRASLQELFQHPFIVKQL